MMEFDIFSIIAYAIAIGIGIAGSYFGFFKVKVEVVKNLMETISDALKDGNVTPDEIKAIVEAAKKVVG